MIQGEFLSRNQCRISVVEGGQGLIKIEDHSRNGTEVVCPIRVPYGYSYIISIDKELFRMSFRLNDTPEQHIIQIEQVLVSSSN
jgi:hypothetical protein